MENFTELNLSSPLLRAISELGFEKPSPIQAQALPILLGEPTDFLGLAATGTGKTAAFSIPLLERIDADDRSIQGLVLCPTRELAMQVAGQIELIGKHKGIRALAIYGGAGYSEQIAGLRRGVHVVVGTPGRLCDHMDRGTLDLSSLQTVILDEADEMISMGFKEDLEKILSGTPSDQRKIWLFSATMSPGVRKVADEYLRNPGQVQVNRTEMLSDTVEQVYYLTQESNKPEVLCKLIDAAEDFYGLIFFQTKALVIDAQAYLRERGYKSDCLHGDMDQAARERVMKAFRDKKVNILLCTDVASRGLDVKDISHVINYSIPRELDSYVHRIGRTARSGKAGLALSLVTPSHRVLISRIEKMTKSRMKEGRIPTRKEIGAKKIARILTTYQAQEGHVRAIELLDDAWKAALAAMPVEEVAGRFLSIMYPEVFGASREEPPVREERRERSYGGGSSDRPSYGDRGGDRDGGGRYGRPTGRPAPRFANRDGGAGQGGDDRAPAYGAGYGARQERGPGYAKAGPRIERGAGYGPRPDRAAGYSSTGPKIERGAGYGPRPTERATGFSDGAPIERGPGYGRVVRTERVETADGPVVTPKAYHAKPKAIMPKAAAEEFYESTGGYGRKPMRASQAAPSDTKKRPSVGTPAPWSWKAKAKTDKVVSSAKPATTGPRPHFKERQSKVVKTEKAESASSSKIRSGGQD